MTREETETLSCWQLSDEEESAVQEMFRRTLIVRSEITAPIDISLEKVNNLLLDSLKNKDTLSDGQKVRIREEFLNRVGLYYDECMK